MTRVITIPAYSRIDIVGEPDVLIVVNTCGDPRYIKRLLAFRQYGITLSGPTRVCLCLLVGTHSCFLRDALTWPWHCDTLVVEDVLNEPFKKIASFLRRLRFEEGRLAPKWYMKVDDDSITDIEMLVSSLDSVTSTTPTYYCSGYFHERCNGHVEEITRILPSLKVFAHEWEASIMNREAMGAILDSKACHVFIDSVLSTPSRLNSDWIWSAAAWLAGVAIEPCPLMTSWAAISNLSLFGGKIAHVHFVAPEYASWSHLEYLKSSLTAAAPNSSARMALIQSMVKIRKSEATRMIREALITRASHKLTSAIWSDSLVMKFQATGEVIPGGLPYFCRWETTGGRLVLYDANGAASAVFYRCQNGRLQGVSLHDLNVSYILEPTSQEPMDNPPIVPLHLSVIEDREDDTRSELQALAYLVSLWSVEELVFITRRSRTDSELGVLRLVRPGLCLQIVSLSSNNKAPLAPHIPSETRKNLMWWEEPIPDDTVTLQEYLPAFRYVALSPEPTRGAAPIAAFLPILQGAGFVLSSTITKNARSTVSPMAPFRYSGAVFIRQGFPLLHSAAGPSQPICNPLQPPVAK